MQFFKISRLFCTLFLMISFMHLQCMEVNTDDYILNDKGRKCYEKLLQRNEYSTTKALLQITKEFRAFAFRIEELQALAVTERLIKNGADINSVGSYKLTPLIFAVSKRNSNLAALLMRHGAHVDGNLIEKLTPHDGYTPLMEAIKNCDMQMIAILIEEFGASVNFQNLHGSTALHVATNFAITSLDSFLGKARRNIIKFLLSKGADCTLANYYGRTPLMIAQQDPTNVIENLLLNSPTNHAKRLQDQKIRTLITNYLQIQDTEQFPIVGFLTEFFSGISCFFINKQVSNSEPIEPQKPTEHYPKQSHYDLDSIQELTLQEASGNSEAKKKLLLNYQNKQGKTPLMTAAEKNFIPVIKYLLIHGADAGIVDNKRKSALNYAYKNGNQECINALIHYIYAGGIPE
jgi:ankyrin repeat protein